MNKVGYINSIISPDNNQAQFTIPNETIVKTNSLFSANSGIQAPSTFEPLKHKKVHKAKHRASAAAPGDYSFTYTAGDRTRRRFLPLNKDVFLGKGTYSDGVFLLDKEKLRIKNPKSPLLNLSQDLAVKKGIGYSYEHEFKMGNMMDHANLVKSHALFTRLPGEKTSGAEQFIVMDKVDANKLTPFIDSNFRKVPNDVVVDLISSYRDCCLYLFDRGVAWCEVNEGNILVEKETNRLKLIDFAFWHEEADPAARAYKLLLGAIEGTSWILQASSLTLKKGEGKHVGAFIFPTFYFGENFKPFQVMSIVGIEFMNRNPTMKSHYTMITEFRDDPEGLKMYLNAYFEAVLCLVRREFAAKYMQERETF